MENRIIETKNGNRYFYSPLYRTISICENTEDDEYNRKKFQYLSEHLFFKDVNVKFKTHIDESFLIRSLENMSHLLIEVTDGCNLSCKYCGYGELYGNYDARHNSFISFEDVKALIDFLTDSWQKKNKQLFTVIVGFYGGEPLLNIKLIEQCVGYLSSVTKRTGIQFRYNMTTNSMLLHRYMDFLYEHKFNLLLSLDGNRLNDSYRIMKNGKESFSIVFNNIKKLQRTYPDYFESYVNFNAVLHNRNSVPEIMSFIQNEFGKRPLVSELSTIGIREDRRNEFQEMFNSRLSDKNTCGEGLYDLEMDPYKNILNSFMSGFLDVNYNSVYELFLNKEECTYIPTGTCRPLERKLFLTVNGKLLSCERVGQAHVLGNIKNGIVNMDLKEVSMIYSRLYKMIIRQCNQCTNKLNCGQCVFQMKENKKGEIVCKSFRSFEMEKNYLAENLSLLEEHPERYKEIINKMTIL